MTGKRSNKSIQASLIKTDLGFDYRLRLSNRKSSAIEVKNGTVTVAAPKGSNTKQLHLWVIEKSNWIQIKLANQNAKKEEVFERDFSDGEQLSLMGKLFSLRVIYNKRTNSQIKNDEICIYLPYSQNKYSAEIVKDKIKTAIADWYKQSADQYMTSRTHYLADGLNRKVVDVKYRHTKTKWGHCTSLGVIQYNWLIMMAPKKIIDYLITHEVCHLVHPNHSQKFWLLVESIDPNYRDSRDWLKVHGHKFRL
jgi:predicted metal-dependent hydrolase